MGPGNLPYTDPWTVLGVQRGAGKDEIKAAFRRAALACHPDVDKSPSAAARFADVKAAADVLLKGVSAELAGVPQKLCCERMLWMFWAGAPCSRFELAFEPAEGLLWAPGGVWRRRKAAMLAPRWQPTTLSSWPGASVMRWCPSSQPGLGTPGSALGQHGPRAGCPPQQPPARLHTSPWHPSAAAAGTARPNPTAGLWLGLTAAGLVAFAYGAWLTRSAVRQREREPGGERIPALAPQRRQLLHALLADKQAQAARQAREQGLERGPAAAAADGQG
ncbi:hypothetical protein ABPG77_005600 [Micractinium sp. CCAP 211/92]